MQYLYPLKNIFNPIQLFKQKNMKKFLLSVLVCSVLGLNAIAQIAKVNTSELNKVSRPCVSADYGMTYEIVEGAFKKKFADMKFGSGDKTKDGYRLFKGVTFSEISPNKIDLYYRVEDRKPNTTVYFLMSSGYDIFLKPETDSVIYQNAIVFMDKFVRDATAFQLNRDIEKQLEVIKDVEKKMKGVAKDQESYQKDKAKAESKISQNIIEQGALKSEWESQKKLLETVKAKTATLDQMDALKKEVSKQEDATAKAEKKYNNSMKDDEEYKGDLNKAESKIGEAQIEMDKVKTELQNENNKLAELRAQLAAL
jgi:hypothetical protein